MTCSRRGLPRAVWGSGKGWLGGGARGGVQGLRFRGGVGGRGTGPRRSKFRNVCRIFVKEEKLRFLKDALWGGAGYPPELAWWGNAGLMEG